MNFPVTQNQSAVGLGVFAGLFVGKWAFEHLFVEGLDTKMRRDLIALGAGAGACYGLAYLLDVDFNWFTTTGATQKAEQWWRESGP